MKNNIKSSSKKQIRVLLTSSRGAIALGRVEALKNNSDYNFYIIGTDASLDNFKLPLVDEQIKVPLGDEPNFFNELKDIALKKKVDVIIPASDFELESIAKYKNEFEKIGSNCVCSDYEITKTAMNKADMLDYLKSKGVAVPKFFIPKNTDELEKMIKELGYPKNPAIFKPASSGGGNRGVWLVQEDFSKDFLNTKAVPFISLSELISQLKKLKTFPHVVVMEYLPGEEYSVDGLGQNGNPRYIIPRVRVSPLPGYSQEGLIKSNTEVLDYVTEICEKFGFDSNFNVQLKYTSDNKPSVYEINPRVSATVVANASAGVDLFLFGILQTAGYEYPLDLKPTSSRMIRFWKEFYKSE